MIIVDTNIWIDHFREKDPILSAILEDGRQRIHPFILGEIALGHLKNRPSILEMLAKMHRSEVAEHREVMALILNEPLYGCGIGYVDAHLLASARLTPGARLWTRDRRLALAAHRLGVAYATVH